MNLGEFVKTYRKENQLSMEEFAKKSGLSKGYISMLEKNENPRSKKPIIPSLDTIKQVAQTIGISLDSIIKQLDSDQEILLVENENLADLLDCQQLDTNSKKAPCHIRLKEGLKLRDLKQTDLCSMTEINKSTMSQYLSGQYEPSQLKLEILARALNVNEAWLMGYDVPMERNQVQGITLQESLHLEKYRKLNASGRQKADEQLDDLLLISKYTDDDSVKSSPDNKTSSASDESNPPQSERVKQAEDEYIKSVSERLRKEALSASNTTENKEDKAV